MITAEEYDAIIADSAAGINISDASGYKGPGSSGSGNGGNGSSGFKPGGNPWEKAAKAWLAGSSDLGGYTLDPWMEKGLDAGGSLTDAWEEAKARFSPDEELTWDNYEDRYNQWWEDYEKLSDLYKGTFVDQWADEDATSAYNDEAKEQALRLQAQYEEFGNFLASNQQGNGGDYYFTPEAMDNYNKYFGDIMGSLAGLGHAESTTEGEWSYWKHKSDGESVEDWYTNAQDNYNKKSETWDYWKGLAETKELTEYEQSKYDWAKEEFEKAERDLGYASTFADAELMTQNGQQDMMGYLGVKKAGVRLEDWMDTATADLDTAKQTAEDLQKQIDEAERALLLMDDYEDDGLYGKRSMMSREDIALVQGRTREEIEAEKTRLEARKKEADKALEDAGTQYDLASEYYAGQEVIRRQQEKQAAAEEKQAEAVDTFDHGDRWWNEGLGPFALPDHAELAAKGVAPDVGFADVAADYMDELTALDEEARKLQQERADLEVQRQGSDTSQYDPTTVNLFGLPDVLTDEEYQTRLADIEERERELADKQRQASLGFNAAKAMAKDEPGYQETVERGQLAYDQFAEGFRDRWIENSETKDAILQDMADRAETDASFLGAEGAFQLGDAYARSRREKNLADVSVGEDWSDDEANWYHWLMGTGKQDEAFAYAESLNRYYNDKAHAEKTAGATSIGAGTAKWKTDADGNFILDKNGERVKNEDYSWLGNTGRGLLGFGASLVTMPDQFVSWMDKVATTALSETAFGGNGYYAGRRDAWLSDQANALLAGRAQQMNENGGTLGDEWGFLAGKGWGDAYQLANSMVQSFALGTGLTSAYMAGGLEQAAAAEIAEVATLAGFFGQAANSAFDEAIRRGANANQATYISMMSGVAEVAGEKFSLENLLNQKAWMGNWFAGLFMQGVIEGSEEGFTDLLNLFGDEISARLTGGKTEMEQELAELMSSGMSYKEASKKIWRDMAFETAFDVLGGFLSGGLSGAPMQAVQAAWGQTNYKGEGRNSQESLLQEARSKGGETAKMADEYDGQRFTKQRAQNLKQSIADADISTIENAAKRQLQARDSSLTDEQAVRLAKAVLAEAMGEADAGQQELLNRDNKFGTGEASRLVFELQTGVYTNQNRTWLNDLNTTRVTLNQTERSRQAAQQTENLPAEFERGVTVNGEALTITGISSDGAVQAKNSKGDTVTVDKADLSADQRSTVDTLTNRYGTQAGAVLRVMQTATGDFATLGKAADMIYTVASNSSKDFDAGMLRRNLPTYTQYFNDEQMKALWDAARFKRAQDQQIQQKRFTRHAVKDRVVGEKYEVRDGGKLYVFEGADLNSAELTDDQKATIQLAGVLTNAAKGRLQINFFHGGDSGFFGQYQNGRIDLNIDRINEAGKSMVTLTLAHELTHFIQDFNATGYNKLKTFMIDKLMDSTGKSMEQLIKEKQARQIGLDRQGAIDEIIADGCEMMLQDGSLIDELGKIDRKLAVKVKDFVKGFLDRLSQELTAKHYEATELGKYVKEQQEIWNKALTEAMQSGKEKKTAREAKAERIIAEAKEQGVAELTNTEGQTVGTVGANNRAQLSLDTWRKGGRAMLQAYLKQQAKEGNLTEADVKDMMRQMDIMYDICDKYDDGTYAPFTAWSNATVVTGRDGQPVFSVIKQNGEYKLNLDFSLVCKKRRALDAVFNEMIRQGIMDDFGMFQESIGKINEIIRENGFEVACALCFVDSKRYRQAMIADQFTMMYNTQVSSLLKKGSGQKIDYFNYGGDETLTNTGAGIDTLADDELDWTKIDKILAQGKSKTVEYKIAKYLKEHPEGRKRVQRGDFMSTRGFDALKVNNPELLSLYNSKKGAGGPKAAQSDVQYLNDILKNAGFNQKAAYEVGGVRIQSFSDYMGRMVFDYIQMIGDLAAKQLPAHSYTKEYLYALQFGLTGIKINMSLVPDVVAGAPAGLDRNGNYVWKDGQSFGSTVYDNRGSRMTAAEGFELAKRIQNAKGYSKNCGTIAVGVSDEHIRKMLDDPEIRMIIPYHKSSLNHILALMNNIDKYKDYTKVQNTRKNGKKLESGDFNFNEALQRLGDAKAAADEYLAWCEKNGYTPKFDAFADHENYYKLLEDFSCYDTDGVTNTPLSAVQLNFPTAQDAFGSMQDLIREGLEEDTLLQANMDRAVPDIVKQIQAVLPGFEQSIKQGKKKSAAKATQKVQLSKADVQALAEEHSKESSIRFQRRDISEVPSDISSFVDNALTNRGSNNSITITLATKWDNSAINKLGRTWQGKYTGSERTIDGRYVRHVIKQHGDPIIEALRGQLYMDADAIKIAISKLRSGEGRVIGGTFSTRNLPTVVTQIPINGYTLYAEEPAVLLNGTELQGRTMYLAPTSTTALTQAATKGTGTIPQRRSGGYIHSINISSRIVNGYLTDKSGDKANLTYLVGKDGKPGTGSMGGVFLLGNDADAIGKYATNGRTTGMANVRVTNPYYVTMGNPVITSTDIEDGTIQDRIAELKAAGYDAIVMDYKQGDNYMVMVFNQGQIESVQQNAQMSRADVDYDNAVKAGDMDTAAWMVNQAAKDAGAITTKTGRSALHLYHGTPSFGFTEFRPGVIFLTDNPSIAAGYTQNKGYGRKRQISEAYTPDDGTANTLIQNARNVLGHEYREVTQEDIDFIHRELKNTAQDMSNRMDDAWDTDTMDILNGFFDDGEMPLDLSNDFSYMVAMPGAVAENIDDMFAGEYSVYSEKDLLGDLERTKEAEERVREFLREHWKDIKGTKAESLYRLLTGYDYGDFLIDVEFKIPKALHSEDMLAMGKGDTFSIFSREGTRQAIEEVKDVGAYDLYAFAGDNPLVIDGDGAFWTSIKAPQLGEGTFTTDHIAKLAKERGYTSVTIRNIMDSSMNNYASNVNSDIYIMFDQNQVKSADPVTYDDAGDVIPLSERFNQEKTDIRFSREDVGETQFDEQGYQDLVKRATEAQTAFHNALEEERAFYASDEFKAWEERVRSGEISPEFLAEYAAWEEKSGIREIKARREQYNDEYIRLSKEVAAATAARKTAARAAKKTGTSAADTNRKAAVKEFGYTPYFYDAGYILPNGGMLNFSGDKGKHYGVRGNDHRAIGTIYDDVDGTAAMNRFISEGNIRIMPEAPGLTVFTGIQPTAKQYSVIRDFVREYAGKEYFVVDLSDENGRTVGKLEYTGRLSAERVVGDMKQYYKTGEIRQQSTVSQFFSREDVAEEDLERKLAESEAARGKLEKAIQTAQKQLEFWRNEADQPGKKGIYKANPRDVQRFAKGLLEEYPYTTVKASQITERIQKIADGFMNQEDTGDLYRIALDIAEEIIENSYVRIDNEMNLVGLNGTTDADLIKQHLKGYIYVAEQDRADIASQLRMESFEQVRRRFFKYRIYLTSDLNKATKGKYLRTIDSLYEELAPSYGWKAGMMTISEMMEIIDAAITEDVVNPYYDVKSELSHMDIDHVAELAETIFEGAISEDVRQYFTRAEKAARQLDEAKANAAEQKLQARERLEAERENNRQALKRERQRTADVRKRLAATRATDAARLRALREQKNRRMNEIIQEERRKRRDLINRNRENRERRETRQKIWKLQKEAQQLVSRPTEKAYVPANLMRAMAEMLSVVSSAELRQQESRMDRIDRQLEEMSMTEEQHGKKAAYIQRAIDRLGDLQAKYEAISKDEMYAYTYNEAVKGMLDQLKTYLYGTHLTDGDMSADTLKQIYNIMNALMYTVKNANKLTAMEYQAGIRDLAKELNLEMNQADAKRGLLGTYEKSRMWQMRPDTFFRYICGYAKDSIGEKIQQMFVEGTQRKLTMQRDFYNMFQDITESRNAEERKIYNEMTQDPLKQLVSWGLRDVNGEEVFTTRGMMLQAYMLLEQEDSARSLAIGGFLLPNLKEYYHGNYQEAFGKLTVRTENRMAEYGDLLREARELKESMEGKTEKEQLEIEQQIQATLGRANEILAEATGHVEQLKQNIEDQLTAFDKKIIQTAHEWYDYSGRKLDETNMDLYGFKKPRPKGYVPIHRDLTSVMSVDIRDMQNTVNLENAGFTKSRVKSTNPIMLTDILMELDGNQARMSNFYGFVKVQHDFNAIWKCKVPGSTMTIEGKVSEKFGKGQKGLFPTGAAYVENYVRSVAGGANQVNLMSGLYGNAAAATLSLNPKVALSQLASIPTAAAELGWMPVMKGLARGLQTGMSTKAKQELAQKSVWFWQRYRGEGGMREFAEIKNNRGTAVGRTWNKIASTKAGSLLLNWCQDMDTLATASMWAMAEEYVKARGVDISTEEGQQAVSDAYRDVIRKTQPNYTATERSDLLREQRAGIKFLTMYKTQSNQNLNILMEANGEFIRARKDLKAGAITQEDMNAATAKLARSYSAVIIGGSLTYAALRTVASFLMGALSGYRDDDDELTAESIRKGTMKEFYSSLAGMDAFTGIVYDLLYSSFSGEKYYGISDNAMGALSDVLTGAYKTIQAIMDDEEGNAWEAVHNELKNLCTLAGIPLGNAEKFVSAAKMYYNDLQNGTFGQFEGNVERKPAQEAHRLLNAFRDGDEEKAAQLFQALQESQKGGTDWKRRQQAESFIKNQVKTWYVDDADLTEDQAREILTTYGGMTEDEANEQLREWLGVIENGYDYGDAKDAFITGDLSEDELRIYAATYMGLKGQDLEDAVVNLSCERDTGYAYKDLMQAYVDGAISEQEAVEYRMKYGGYNKAEAEDTVTKWRCEKETGVAYSRLEDAFVDGVLTKQQAVTLQVKYGGKTMDKAEEAVMKWACEKDNGIKYSDIEEAYIAGKVTKQQVVSWEQKYGGRSRDKAEEYLARYEFARKTGVEWSQVHEGFKTGRLKESDLLMGYKSIAGMDDEKAHAYVEVAKWIRDVDDEFNYEKYQKWQQGEERLVAAGVSKTLFAQVAEAWADDPSLKSEYTPEGKLITDSKMKKMMAYIGKLNISAEQKTALAYSFYKDGKKIKKYKTW